MSYSLVLKKIVVVDENACNVMSLFFKLCEATCIMVI